MSGSGYSASGERDGPDQGAVDARLACIERERRAAEAAARAAYWASPAGIAAQAAAVAKIAADWARAEAARIAAGVPDYCRECGENYRGDRECDCPSDGGSND